MSKQKCRVKVESSHGVSWTDYRGARRMVERGMARRVSEVLVIMIETDPRFCAEMESANRARLAIVARNAASCSYRNEFLGLPNFARIGAPRAISHGKAA